MSRTMRIGSRRSGRATAVSSRRRERRRRCRGSISGRPGTSRTSGSTLAPETTHAGSAVEVAPTVYRKLVDAAWTALHATGHGDDRILIGELAPAGATSAGTARAVRRHGPAAVPARALLRRRERPAAARNPGDGARLPGDRRRIGPFRRAEPGAVRSLRVRRAPVLVQRRCPRTSGSPTNPTTPSWPRCPRSSRVLDRLQRTYGSATRFPIWSTEFGYITNPPNDQYTDHPGLGRVLPQLGAVPELGGPADPVL